jgi:hypothetical protein
VGLVLVGEVLKPHFAAIGHLGIGEVGTDGLLVLCDLAGDAFGRPDYI